ncbi:MAG: hypothetical protein P4L50_09725 [Anaerolineaceae bacterium]|nr:hypothetical protein [Anaerolineaceae bacterium]
MFRRFMRQGGGQMGFGPEQINTINQANQLRASGQCEQAAMLFAQLAAAMETSGHPRRAANFHAQAAHTFADANEPVRSLTHARRALDLFLQFQMVRRIPVFYTNITRHLRNKGLVGAADQVVKEYAAKVSSFPMPVQPPQTAQSGPRPVLPPSCPKCGAPVRSDEIEWIDNRSAECIYCGTTLQAVS